MTHTVYLDIVPPKATAQGSSIILQRKDGSRFVGRSKSSPAASAKRILLALLIQQAPPRPFEGPVRVVVDWVYPWRKSEPLKNRGYGLLPCDTKPDVDNLAKMLCDAMTQARFWGDDAQVADSHFRKHWGAVPGIRIKITELNKG